MIYQELATLESSWPFCLIGFLSESKGKLKLFSTGCRIKQKVLLNFHLNQSDINLKICFY